jgi:hypothetical protein
MEVNLAPGKEIELYELKLRPRPASEVELVIAGGSPEGVGRGHEDPDGRH